MAAEIIIPAKLRPGDELRVIAPSRSLSIISEDVRQIALERLKKLGYAVTYGKNTEETDSFISSSVKSRVTDIHDAFRDPNVKGILTSIGGYNSNQLLTALDYELIKANPKVLMGFSDITVLSNAILKKAQLLTYSGPHFSSWGMIEGFDYTETYFRKAVETSESYEIMPAKEWSDDPWFLNQLERTQLNNTGGKIIASGTGEGVLVGGNLSSFSLLKGTDYWPDLHGKVLCLEDDSETSILDFDRYFQSIVHQPGFVHIRALILGRFQKETNISDAQLKTIILSKQLPKDIPIITNLDFGHTTPIATLPIGGLVNVVATSDKYAIKILTH